jgi:hypothetical protein
MSYEAYSFIVEDALSSGAISIEAPEELDKRTSMRSRICLKQLVVA